MNTMQQCQLSRGQACTTAWIPSRGAFAGARVELLPMREVWTVDHAFGLKLPESVVKANQLLNRNSLPSVQPIA